MNVNVLSMVFGFLSPRDFILKVFVKLGFSYIIDLVRRDAFAASGAKRVHAGSD
jgi:hypothetical protein